MGRAANQKKRRRELSTTPSGSVEPAVESYLRSVGIGDSQDQHLFWERLRRKHGPIVEEVARAISAREEGQDVDVYALKNKTLPLSIDVTAQYSSQMYAEFLSWFLREKFARPKTLLDVGCDNGILTCFYATLYPEAAVVGVDKCEQGIACAQKLAMRLNVTNVRFEARDLLEVAGTFPDHSFDLIVSTTVFHEVLRFPEDFSEDGEGASDEACIESQVSDSAKIVTDLVRLLPDMGGTFVSMERCLDAAGLAWWIRVLNRAGLSIMADRSTLLEFLDEHRELQMLPILVARRSPEPTVIADEAALAFRMYQEAEENT